MPIKIITAEDAPKAVGPYSQAVEVGGFLFLSGVLPLDPVTGQVDGGDVKLQTVKIMENMSVILKEAGLDFKHLVKTTVYMTNLVDFADMNDVYAKYFTENPPARTTVQVVALPRGVMVEIEAIARKK